MDVHGTHHSTVSALGGTIGRNVPRSRRGGTRTGLRGMRSGCVTGVRRLLTRGSGRVVAIW